MVKYEQHAVPARVSTGILSADGFGEAPWTSTPTTTSGSASGARMTMTSTIETSPTATIKKDMGFFLWRAHDHDHHRRHFRYCTNKKRGDFSITRKPTSFLTGAVPGVSTVSAAVMRAPEAEPIVEVGVLIHGAS